MPARRFPPRSSVEQQEACFVVRKVKKQFWELTRLWLLLANGYESAPH